MPCEATILLNRIENIVGSRSLASAWSQKPNRLFGGRSPIDAILSPGGRRKSDQILAWYEGRPAASCAAEVELLQDIDHDSFVRMGLQRAESGPEEMVQLIRPLTRVKRAA